MLGYGRPSGVGRNPPPRRPRCELSALIAPPALAADWVGLLDGKTLPGWRQHDGTAIYRVVDCAIVGETTECSPNSFLYTTGDNGDFETEFDLKVHDRLTSGIFRVAPRRPCQCFRSLPPRCGPQSTNEAFLPASQGAGLAKAALRCVCGRLPPGPAGACPAVGHLGSKK